MIQTIAVIGTGVMGQGIAYVSAIGGFQTIMVDVSNEVVKRAEQNIRSLMEQSVQKGFLQEEQASEAKNRLHVASSIEQGISEADVVIEAVPEKMALKKSVFEQIDRYAKPTCYVATNTSTMSPTEIASFTSRPDRVIAMHFFNPVHKMKLVEMIRGLETSDDTTAVIEQVAKKMGKETVVVNEFPGFVTSRMSALVGNEAFCMLQEGVGTPEEIDTAIKLGLNYPMGPFELVDLVGLDVRLNNLNYLYETLGEKYRPAPLLIKYVKAGRLGKKTGKGVYEYDEFGQRK
ncbi:3-hydroxyacyl-CoA dehydrogenase [Massilibacterium senegalense]|uniref:3-hydroxyacyl-CoA dehydrogenase n=1 Tax=Massilibacterium senegalense TaxID=1632858 RepID=UPI0007840D35|nr:3-hydroxyacyl-CoA dehydrogenase [Massilibacterium senegalense]